MSRSVAGVWQPVERQELRVHSQSGIPADSAREINHHPECLLPCRPRPNWTRSGFINELLRVSLQVYLPVNDRLMRVTTSSQSRSSLAG
jgi:hypothetical protein